MAKQLKRTWRQLLGSHYEALALKYLQERGLALLYSNYRCKLGEIDLIMQEGDMLVFVEVRFRKSASHGTAAATVDSRKQAKLRQAARHFLYTHPRYAASACRFDVLAVESATIQPPRINWIPGAFY